MPRKRTKRADGRYQLKRKMPDGSSRFFYGKTITEAQDKYEAACRQVILDEQKQNGGATFREMAQAYRDYITGQGTPIKCSTIKSYKRYLKIFTEHFGDTPMQEIDAQAVCGLMENMKVSGKSLHTITNAKSVLSCVFKFWCANYHGTSDPVLLAAPPAGMKRGRRDEPTAEQQQIIHDHPEGCGFWAQLFEYTGLRVSEANALQWKDVDFAAGCIHVRGAMPWDYNNAYFETPKSRNGYRDVPILSPFRPALLARAEGHEPTDYVMSGCAEPLTQSQYRARWVMYCRPIGLTDYYLYEIKKPASSTRPASTVTRKVYRATVTAHQFRHLYASNLYYARVPDMVAQKLMGHADIMTTRRVYQQFRDEEDRKYIDQLNAYVTDKAESKDVHK